MKINVKGAKDAKDQRQSKEQTANITAHADNEEHHTSETNRNPSQALEALITPAIPSTAADAQALVAELKALIERFGAPLEHIPNRTDDDLDAPASSPTPVTQSNPPNQPPLEPYSMKWWEEKLRSWRNEWTTTSDVISLLVALLALSNISLGPEWTTSDVISLLVAVLVSIHSLFCNWRK